jgi:hypothetical protein
VANRSDSAKSWGASELWLLARTVPLVILGSLLQKLVPMTRWGHLIGEVHRVPKEISSIRHDHEMGGESASLAKAIARACTLLPWTPSCLAQAFAGQRILHAKGKPGAVVVGLRPESAVEWPAHAWLIADGHIITGGAISHQYFPASVHSFENPLSAIRPKPSPQ